MKIECESLSFSYGKRKVLDDVSFSLERGKALSILGPNGAGKTTLFRLILNTLKRDGGKIKIDDRDISTISKRELSSLIAYIPQSCNPTFNCTVLEEVLMGIAGRIGIFGTPKKEDEEKALFYLDSLGILKLKDRGVLNISGGERRLTLIARALTQEAKFFLLDEMTSNLDYGNSYLTMKKIEELKNDGYGIIFTTHNPSEAFDFSDITLLIKDGKTLSYGETKSILNEGTLKEIYNISVSVKEVEVNGERRMVSVPYVS